MKDVWIDAEKENKKVNKKKIAILTIIIYPIIMKFGYKLEENFKEKVING